MKKKKKIGKFRGFFPPPSPPDQFVIHTPSPEEIGVKKKKVIIRPVKKKAFPLILRVSYYIYIFFCIIFMVIFLFFRDSPALSTRVKSPDNSSSNSCMAPIRLSLNLPCFACRSDFCIFFFLFSLIIFFLMASFRRSNSLKSGVWGSLSNRFSCLIFKNKYSKCLIAERKRNISTNRYAASPAPFLSKLNKKTVKLSRLHTHGFRQFRTKG